MTTTSNAAQADAGAGADDSSALSFELVNVPLPTLSARERSLPIRPADLMRVLLAEPGVSPDDRVGLAELAALLGAVFHHEFYRRLSELKELYAPIDPDSDCFSPNGLAHDDRPDPFGAFLGPLEELLVRANYVKLDRKELECAISAPNHLGLDYMPNLDLFEHLRVYVRGEGRVRRVVRSLATLFRRRTVVYDAYRRVVIALKYSDACPSGDLEEYVRPDALYLRMFKDVPYVEMEMHLPEHGTKIRMPWPDKLQIASPVMTSVPAVAARVLLEAGLSPFLLGLMVFAPISAGVRSFLGYRSARRRHLHHMIRHLYYLTLANNSGAITRLTDSAEEEEFKEAMLAYFTLWRGADDPDPWTDLRLDQSVEAFLRTKTGFDLDFEVDDAVAKLLRLGLARRNAQGHLLITPLDRAIEALDDRWNHYFTISHPSKSPNVKQELEKRDCGDEPGRGE